LGHACRRSAAETGRPGILRREFCPAARNGSGGGRFLEHRMLCPRLRMMHQDARYKRGSLVGHRPITLLLVYLSGAAFCCASPAHSSLRWSQTRPNWSASRLGALSLSCEGRPLPSSHAIAVSESIALAIAQYALGSCPALARRASSTADGTALEHRTRKVESIFRIDPMLIPLNGASFRRKPGPLFAHADLRFRNVR
jgi:hypothetical protein